MEIKVFNFEQTASAKVHKHLLHAPCSIIHMQQLPAADVYGVLVQ